MDLLIVAIVFSVLLLLGIGLLAISFTVKVGPQQILIVATSEEQTPIVYRNGRKFLLPMYHRHAVFSLEPMEFNLRSRTKAHSGELVDSNLSIGIHFSDDQNFTPDMLFKLVELRQRRLEEDVRGTLMRGVQQTIQSPRYAGTYQHRPGLFMDHLNNCCRHELQENGLKLLRFQILNLSPTIEENHAVQETSSQVAAPMERHMDCLIKISVAGEGTLKKDHTQIKYEARFGIESDPDVIGSFEEWSSPRYRYLRTLSDDEYANLMKIYLKKGIERTLTWLVYEHIKDPEREGFDRPVWRNFQAFAAGASMELKEVGARAVACQIKILELTRNSNPPSVIDPMTLNFNFQDIPEKESVPLTIPVRLVVGVGEEPPLSDTAARELNGLSEAEIEARTRAIIEERFPKAIRSMTIKDINRSQEWFYQGLIHEINSGLHNYGLWVINITVSDITDSVGILEGMRAKALEEYRSQRKNQ